MEAEGKKRDVAVEESCRLNLGFSPVRSWEENTKEPKKENGDEG